MGKIIAFSIIISIAIFFVSFLVTQKYRDVFKPSKRLKKWTIVCYILLALLMLLTVVETIFDEFYMKHFQTIRIFDNAFFGLVMMIFLYTSCISTFEWIKGRKDDKKE